MSNISNLIPLALEYFDKNNHDLKNFVDKIDSNKTETIKNKKDLEKNKILFFDKNSKKLLESEYEVIGIFYKKYNTWIWSWAIPSLSKNQILTSRKLLSYALDIDLNQDNNKQFEYIKSELVTSRSKINSKLQLDIYLALVSYLSKKKFIYKQRYYINNQDPNNYVDYYLFIINEDILKTLKN